MGLQAPGHQSATDDEPARGAAATPAKSVVRQHPDPPAAAAQRRRDRKAVVWGRGRQPDRDGADTARRQAHHLRLHAGRLRPGLPLLPDRAGRPGAQPAAGGNRWAGVVLPGTGPGTGAGLHEHRVHGHGRAARQLSRYRAGGAHSDGRLGTGHFAAPDYRLNIGSGAPPGGVRA